MDEILIEEKRYISSKRAAKVTGYAKDYIGQLCREGRVPARLVGRNWYVLETAIHDHRFGQQVHASTEGVETEPSVQASQSTWESPRYEASSAEVLPSVNRAAQDAGTPPADVQHEAPQYLQDSWREWFDRIADTAASAIPDVISSGKPTEEEEREEREEVVADEKDEKEVRIPIRAIHHQRYQAPPEELLPQALTQEAPRRRFVEDGKSVPEEVQWQRKTSINRSTIIAIRGIGVLLATSAVILAIIGSGYLDTQISGTRVGIFAGIVTYNK